MTCKYNRAGCVDRNAMLAEKYAKAGDLFLVCRIFKGKSINDI